MKQQQQNLKKKMAFKTQKKFTNDLECVMCNKVVSKVFWKPHYKRANILFIEKRHRKKEKNLRV